MAEAASKRTEVPWLEPVLLLEARQRAERTSDVARMRMKPWALAAESRCRVARELRDAETQTVALSLLRESTYFALCGLLAAEIAESELPRTLPDAWTRFDTRVSTVPSEDLVRVRAVFTSEDPLALERVPRAEVNELRLSAERGVASLLAQLELRTPRELTRVRIVRLVLCVLAALAIASFLVAYSASLDSIAPR